MKNIFKMMGIALLACSMVMVSCKKDDDKTDGGQGGNTGAVTVKFNNQALNLPVQEGYYYNLGEENPQLAGLQAFTFIGAASASAEEYGLPMIESNAMCYQGTYTIAEQLGLGKYFPTIAYVDETENAWYIQKLNADPVFGTFDATNNTLGFTYDVQLYNYNEWVAAMQALIAAGGYTEADLENEELYQQLSDQADQQTSFEDCYVKLDNFVFTPSTYFSGK
jgi:hypothetical protein